MRRTAPLVLFTSLAVLTLSACGDGSDGAGDTVSTELASAGSVDGDVDTTAPDTGPVDTSADDAPADTFEDVGPPATNPDKPEVEIPAEPPTELVRTVLEEGTGEPAEAGDTLIVDYVGVRSVDGVEFDNSYDREPFPITLGAGGVIAGWDEGLLGSKQGERVQLDIPSDLAYGETARSDVIRENEDLTFVIDVRSVIRQADGSEAPTEPGVPLSEGAEESSYEDLVVGEGDTIENGDTALIRYVNFRGDNGVALEANWADDPLQIPYDEVQLFPGLYTGMEGMKVGGRRAITIIPEDGFGAEGNPQGGLPANTDMIFVVELLGAY